MLALFYTEGIASAFCLGPAQGFSSELGSCIQYASEGANANFLLLSLLVRFMPPPHAQPPGSNKSQRGRECCKGTITLQFLCEGQGDRTCGDQPVLPGM